MLHRENLSFPGPPVFEDTLLGCTHTDALSFTHSLTHSLTHTHSERGTPAAGDSCPAGCPTRMARILLTKGKYLQYNLVWHDIRFFGLGVLVQK